MKLNYKVYGEQNTDSLIILHGLFGMLDNWTTLAKRFANDYKVFIIDQRNHGKSDHTNAIDYDLMTDDLFQFFEEQGIYTANLIGHSMGGKTVMAFTNKFPERVERLVVVDIAPKKYEPKHTDIIDALCDLPINSLENRQEADEWLSKRIESFSIRQFLLKNLSRNKNGFEWKMNLEVIVANYEKIIGDVSIANGFDRPVLMLYGGDSNYIDQDDFEMLENHYSMIQRHKVLGAGHWVHAEKPDEFYDVVSDFLESPLF